LIVSNVKILFQSFFMLMTITWEKTKSVNRIEEDAHLASRRSTQRSASDFEARREPHRPEVAVGSSNNSSLLQCGISPTSLWVLDCFLPPKSARFCRRESANEEEGGV